MRNSTNRQGVTLYHDLYENQLQYMSKEKVGRLICTVFEYSIDRANGISNPQVSYDGFDGYEAGALRSAIKSVDRACDNYLNKAVNTKLSSIDKNRDHWDTIKAKPAAELRKLGFTTEQIAYMKSCEVEDIITQVQTSTLKCTQEHQQEQETEYKTEQENKQDKEPEHNLEYERPIIPRSRQDMITLLGREGISLADANQLLNQFPFETVSVKLNAWHREGKPGDLRAYIKGWM